MSLSDPCSRPDADASLPALAERLRRLAALVADGRTPLPNDLCPEDLAVVLAEVGRLRRARLIRFVAGAIADDFCSSSEPFD